MASCYFAPFARGKIARSARTFLRSRSSREWSDKTSLRCLSSSSVEIFHTNLTLPPADNCSLLFRLVPSYYGSNEIDMLVIIYTRRYKCSVLLIASWVGWRVIVIFSHQVKARCPVQDEKLTGCCDVIAIPIMGQSSRHTPSYQRRLLQGVGIFQLNEVYAYCSVHRGQLDLPRSLRFRQ